MTRAEQIALLTRGVKAWNTWRVSSDVAVDLREADLSKLDLRGASLHSADLRGSVLRAADLRQSELVDSNLTLADLGEANLSEADLRGANLYGATLFNANLSKAILGGTILANVDLRDVFGLDDCQHQGFSAVDYSTLSSSSKVSRSFLAGTGLPQSFLDYLPTLVEPSPHFYSCFLSYAQANADFATRLHGDLQGLGVRSWFAPHDLRLGDRLWEQIDSAIRVHDKLVVVLSSASVHSGWVSREVEKAIETERLTQRTVLFPVFLDDAVFRASSDWAIVVRQRSMGDFSKWHDEKQYTQALSRLAKALTVTAASEVPRPS